MLDDLMVFEFKTLILIPGSLLMIKNLPGKNVVDTQMVVVFMNEEGCYYVASIVYLEKY